MPDRWRTGSRRTRSLVACEDRTVGQVIDVRDADSPLDSAALLKRSRDRGDRAEQPVAANASENRRSSSVRLHTCELAMRIDDVKESTSPRRGEGEAATVDVGRQRAAERQAVGARLLLDDAHASC
jgi:hypothetical protein